MSGVQEKEDFDTLLQEVSDEVMDDEAESAAEGEKAGATSSDDTGSTEET